MKIKPEQILYAYMIIAIIAGFATGIVKQNFSWCFYGILAAALPFLVGLLGWIVFLIKCSIKHENPFV